MSKLDADMKPKAALRMGQYGAARTTRSGGECYGSTMICTTLTQE
jgi:hypothetical protein